MSLQYYPQQADNTPLGGFGDNAPAANRNSNFRLNNRTVLTERTYTQGIKIYNNCSAIIISYVKIICNIF